MDDIIDKTVMCLTKNELKEFVEKLRAKGKTVSVWKIKSISYKTGKIKYELDKI